MGHLDKKRPSDGFDVSGGGGVITHIPVNVWSGALSFAPILFSRNRLATGDEYRGESPDARRRAAVPFAAHG